MTQDELKALLEPTVEGLGYELADLELKIGGRDGLVRVFIDKPDGIGLDDCERVSRQISTVLSGEFEVDVDGEIRTLKAGDSFVIPGGVMHQASCIETGILLDAFSPRRDDFLGES